MASVNSVASGDSQVLVADESATPSESGAEASASLDADRTTEDAIDRRKRLALALDQTAAMMEGGKSLAMAKEELIRSPQPEQGAFATFDVPPEVPDTKEAEQRIRKAEKRKRTIQELVDTEALYATDMAVVRDIYLERARGVGELTDSRALSSN